MIVIDSHCDTPSQLVRLRDLSLDNEMAHVDYPKLKAGGVDASFFALYTPPGMEPDAATAYCFRMVSQVYDSLSANKGSVSMALTAEDIRKNKEKGLISILMGMENGAPIQDSLSFLRLFHTLGVRYVTLTHNEDNLIADSAAQGKRWGGLSPFGREVVAEMNRLGMIVDLAHASDDTFYDCIKYSKSPVVTTHSCCRALAHHRRNLSDDMLRALAENDGVIQINFYPAFLSDEFGRLLDSSGLGDKADEIEMKFKADPSDPVAIENWMNVQKELMELERPSYKDVVDHIDHAVEIAGIDHVGFGSDFDGICVCPKGLENVSKIGILFDEMRRRGYDESAIEKVAGGNFLRIMEKVQKVAQSIDTQ